MPVPPYGTEIDSKPILNNTKYCESIVGIDAEIREQIGIQRYPFGAITM